MRQLSVRGRDGSRTDCCPGRRISNPRAQQRGACSEKSEKGSPTRAAARRRSRDDASVAHAIAPTLTPRTSSRTHRWAARALGSHQSFAAARRARDNKHELGAAALATHITGKSKGRRLQQSGETHGPLRGRTRRRYRREAAQRHGPRDQAAREAQEARRREVAQDEGRGGR